MVLVTTNFRTTISRLDVLLDRKKKKVQGMRGDVRDVYTACHEPCPPHPQFEPFVLQGTGSWRVTCRSGEWTALNGK